MRRQFDGKELAVIFLCLQVMLAYLKKWQKCTRLHSTNLKRIPQLQSLIFTNAYLSLMGGDWIQLARKTWENTWFKSQDGVFLLGGGVKRIPSPFERPLPPWMS